MNNEHTLDFWKLKNHSLSLTSDLEAFLTRYVQDKALPTIVPDSYKDLISQVCNIIGSYNFKENLDPDFEKIEGLLGKSEDPVLFISKPFIVNSKYKKFLKKLQKKRKCFIIEVFKSTFPNLKDIYTESQIKIFSLEELNIGTTSIILSQKKIEDDARSKPPTPCLGFEKDDFEKLNLKFNNVGSIVEDFLLHRYMVPKEKVKRTFPFLTLFGHNVTENMRRELEGLHCEVKNSELSQISFLNSTFTKISSKLMKSLGINVFKCTEDEFRQIAINSKNHPLTQCSNYVIEKSNFENSKSTFWLIRSNSVVIGKVAILRKTILGFPIYRINQGPIISDDFSPLTKGLIFEELLSNRMIPIRGVFIIKPLLATEVFRTLKRRMPFHFEVGSVYSSGIIDLQPQEDSIITQFTSVFRNRLKKAQSIDEVSVSFLNSPETFDWVMENYKAYMKEKKFIGIAPDLVTNLYKSKGENILIASAVLDTEIISSIIVLLHENSATYLIGTNTERGRKLDINNLIFWETMKKLKEKGIKYFDLGGIDHINTPSISKFKERMSPIKYELPKELLFPLL